MDAQDHNASPFNSVPPSVVVLVLAIVGIELAFQAGASGLVGGQAGIGWRNSLADLFGFSDPLFEWMRRNATWRIDGLWRFVTYPFVHYELMHAVFAAVLLLAMGKFVAERMSGIAVVAIFFGSAFFGALCYAMVLDQNGVLLGAYPPVYGLIGAYTWTLLTAFEQAGENRLKAFQLIGLLLALQLIFSIFFGGRSDWIADGFGFVAGFLLAIPLSPGGTQRLLDRMRDR